MKTFIELSILWYSWFFQVLGIDTEFCSCESLITGVVDNWSHVLRPHRKIFTVVVCICLFLAGLPMVTKVSVTFAIFLLHKFDFNFEYFQGGIYLFTLVDFYAASGMSLLWICFFETIAISWFYGTGKFSDNIDEMTGKKPWFFWQWCWIFFAPALMAVK